MHTAVGYTEQARNAQPNSHSLVPLRIINFPISSIHGEILGVHVPASTLNGGVSGPLGGESSQHVPRTLPNFLPSEKSTCLVIFEKLIFLFSFFLNINKRILYIWFFHERLNVVYELISFF